MIFKILISSLLIISTILILIGSTLNLIAIVSNGYKMPIKDPNNNFNIEEINKNNFKLFKYKSYKNDSEVNNPLLTDRYINKRKKYPNRYSIGDSFLDFGFTFVILSIITELIFIFIFKPLIPK